MAKAKGLKRPPRDEFELEEMGERLVEAKEEGTNLLLTVWNADSVRGQIVDMDSRTKTVHVSWMGNVVKVPFMDIMKVQSGDNYIEETVEPLN